MSIVNTFSLQSNRQIKINFDEGDVTFDRVSRIFG